MPTLIQTLQGTVSAVWGSALIRGADGKLRPLKVGDTVHQGDVILTSADGIVEVLPIDETAVARPEPAQPSDLDRTIAQLNEDDPQAAPAAGLQAGGGGGLTPGLRVDRISESIGAAAALAGVDEPADQPLPAWNAPEEQLANARATAASSSIAAEEEGAPVNLGLPQPAAAVIAVTEVPAAGQIQRADGSVLAVGDTIVAADVPGLRYVPPADYNPGDPVGQFAYSVEVDGDTTTGSTSIALTAVNDAPMAAADAATGAEDAPIAGNVLANDSDVDGPALAVTQFSFGGFTFAAGSTGAIAGVGTLRVGADGAFTFTPAPDFNGTVPAATYTVSDGSASSTAALSLGVTAVNDAPIAQAGALTVAEGAPVLSGQVTATDVDAGAVLGFILDGAAPAGLVFNADGSYSFDAGHAAYQSLAVGQSTMLTVPYTVTDEHGATSRADLVITVTGTNDAPVAAADLASTPINTALANIVVLANDSDVDGDALSVTAASLLNPALGSVSINADSTLNFTPAANITGPVAISYTITDGQGSNATATLTVNVGANSAPDGANATFTLAEDTSRSFSASDFGFSDADIGQTLSAVRIDTLPGAGTLTLGGAAVAASQVIAAAQLAQLVFTPAANANGVGYAAFSFSVQDSAGAFDAAPNTITLDVTPVADAAVVGGAASGATAEDTTLTASGQLTIVDPDAGEAAFIAQTNIAGAHGTFSIDAAGAWTYSLSNADPAVQALGAGQPLPAETFTVMSIDGTPQVVTVTITGTNDGASITGASSAALTEDAGVTGGNLVASGTLTVSDVDNGEAVFQTPTSLVGSYGSFTFNTATGAWTYAADNAQAAIQALNASSTPLTDSITVTSLDGTASQTITVTIAGVNDASVITGTSVGSVTEDGTIITSGSLSATDVDSAAAFTAANASGTYGDFTIDAAGAWTYTLRNADANVQALTSSSHPTETFTVATADGTTRVITVTVNGANEAPTATVTAASGAEDTAIPVTLSASDVDGSIASFTITAIPANGTLSFNGVALAVGATVPAITNGATLSFTPNADWNGSTSVSFTAVDNEGAASPPVTQSITVAAINDAPTALADSASTPINTALANIVVLANDSDVDGDALSVTAASLLNPALGSVSVNADGTLNFTPAANVTGPVAISYTVSDGQGGNASATLTVNVGANTPPDGANATFTLAEDTSRSFSASDFGFSDADTGQTLSAVRIDTLPGAGTLALGGAAVAAGQVIAAAQLAQLVFTPAANANGTGYAAFSFSVQDSAGAFDTAPNTITLDVTPVGDAAVVGGDASGVVEEDTALTATGTLTVSDPDAGEAAFVPQTNIAGAHGSFSVDATGAWTYSLDNSDPMVQALRANQTLPPETFTVATVDGSTQVVTVTITGTNDDAVISGTAGAALVEDSNLSAGNLVASGTLTVSDVDTGEAVFQTPVTLAGTYGSFTFNAATGAWTYTADNAQAVIQALNSSSAPLTDSITVTSLDGTASQTITVTIAGANDAAVITGTSVGSVTEDGTITTSGSLTATDVDNSAAFTAANVTGAYGDFAIDATGAWTYMLRNADANVQALTSSQAPTETFTVATADGTTRVITVTVNGANEAPTATVTTASGAEDTAIPVTLTASDVDGTIASFTITAIPANGTLSFNGSALTVGDTVTATGNAATLSFTPNANWNGNTSISFTAVDNEGAISAPVTQSITVTAVADAALIGGVISGATVEDATLTASDSLTVTDPDAGEAAFVAQTVAGAHGSFSIDAAGAWTYSLSNGDPSIQALAQGATLAPETFTVTTVDGTSQIVTVTITGTNDGAAITGAASAAVTEDANLVTGNLVASGTLAVSDIDTGEAVFQTPTSLAGSCGSFTFNASTGAWSYTADNAQAAIQALNASSAPLTDSITVTSLDGTASQTITVTIAGVNDAAVITGTSIGSVTEDGTITTSGALSATDADSSAAFTAANVTGTYGDFAIDAAGAWTYTLRNANGNVQALTSSSHPTETFTVATADGTTRVITVTVNGANEAPTATVTPASGFEDTSIPITLAASDVDGSIASFMITAIPANGTLSFNGVALAVGATVPATTNGATLSFTPNADWNGSTSVSFTAVDNEGAASPAVTQSITVAAVNDAPTALADSASTPINTALANIVVLANDSDVDGDVLSVTGASLLNPALGSVSVNPDGTLNFTPGANITGPVAISYTVSDGQGGNASATLTVNVGANTPPDGANATFTLAEDTSRSFSAADFGFSDADIGQTLSAVRIDTLPGAGTLTLGGATVAASQVIAAAQLAQLVFTPAANANGVGYASFNFSVQDSAGAFDAALNTITLDVTPVGDAAVIGGTASGAAVEDTTLTASGQLSIADPDAGEAAFVAQTSVAGAHGTFSIDAMGAWVYTLDNTNPTVQALRAGQSLPAETFTVTSVDGTPQVVTVTITGTNDGASITGDVSASLTEDTAVAGGNLVASGTLVVSDVDNGEAVFQTPTSLVGSYGSFTFNAATGAWTYTADNSQAAIQALNSSSAPLTDSITVASLDGTASQVITVTIAGVNDAAVITGTSVGSVTEDGTVTTGGSLSATDVDSPTAFTAANVTGTYGDFAIDAAGAWTYTLRNADANVQALTSSSHPTETFTVATADGTTRVITVTVNGANEAPTATVTAASGAEDTSIPVTLAASDVDGSIASFTITALPANGTLYFNGTALAVGATVPATANGATLSFTPNANWNGSTSISFTAVDNEGAVSAPVAQSITVTAVGDAAVIGGDASGVVEEDTASTATGTLTVGDPDAGEATFVAQTVAGAHGSFSVDAAGAWTYSLDNSDPMVQALRANQTLPPETFTVTTVDGSIQVVTVTITGTNDDAVISGASSAALTEDAGLIAGNLVAAGTLIVSDVDNGEAVFHTPATLAGTYGSFTFNAATGAWTYTADNSQAAIQALNASSTPLTDSITVTSLDGTASQTVTVTIAGANDAAVITGTSVGSVTEDGTITTSGSLSATDVDSASGFAPANASGTYGDFAIDAAGAWTYTLRNADANVQALTSSSHPTETFTVATADGTTHTITVTVNGANEAPTAAVTAASGAEDTAIPVTLAASDSDGSIASFTITALPANGTLFFNGVALVVGSTIAATANGATLSFTPNANWNGSTSISFSAVDNEGAISAQVTQSIAVTSVNDAPTSSAGEAHIDEGTHVYHFTAGDFPFADAVEGHAQSGVVISTLPIEGALMLNGQFVQQNQTISLADINAGNLSIVSGSAGTIGSFGFKVQDVGGTANGGVDTSSEHVFTVHTDRLVTTTNSNGNNTLNGGSGNDVVLGDTGGIIQTVEAGKNYNISLIVDVSGSMTSGIGGYGSTQRITLLKNALVNLVTQLSDHDGTINVSLIQFSVHASTPVNIQGLNSANVGQLINAINALTASGGTNYEAAFNQAVSWFNNQVGSSKGAAQDYKNLSFFLTDGDPTHYYSNNGKLQGDGMSTSYEVLRDAVSAAKPLVDGTGLLTGTNKVEMHGIGIGNGVNTDYLRFFDNTSATGTGEKIFGPWSWLGIGDTVTGTVGQPQTVLSASQLTAALESGSTTEALAALGHDTIHGGAGNDVIFADAINTDALSWIGHAAGTHDGQGYQALIDYLTDRNGSAPSNTQIYDYIKSNPDQFNVADDTRGGNDLVHGDAGNDIVYGQGGNDTLHGDAGNDRLYGGTGNDTLDGGAGNDVLIGGAGNDALIGGASQDVFRWELADRGNSGAPAADIVTDFNLAAPADGGDVLDLRDLLQGDTTAGGAGNLTNYLHFDTTGGDTVIHISSTGAFSGGFHPSAADQTISLQDVDLSFGGQHSTDQQIIQELMNKSKLLVDSGA